MEAHTYLKNHVVEEKLADAVRNVLVGRPEDPLRSMARMLAPDMRDDSASMPGIPEDPMGTPGGGKRLILVKRPVGGFKESDFKVVDEPIPEADPGFVVVQNILISIDPTHRIWASSSAQYMPAVGLNTVMRALTVGKVVKTSEPTKFSVGSFVSCLGGVQEYAKVAIDPFLNPVVPDVPLSYNHSVLSVLIGMTAWVGVNICDAKPGHTMLISAAAGAVGSIAAQLAKARGATVIGIAGGAEKCGFLKEIGCDGIIDYKSDDVGAKLDELAKGGVDSYLDLVGGKTLEIALTKMKNFAIVAYAGSISGYNKMSDDEGDNQTTTVTNYEMIMMRRLTVTGLICTDHLADIGKGLGEIGALLKTGKMLVKEDIRQVPIDGFVGVVKDLYAGKNQGKLMMRINPE